MDAFGPPRKKHSAEVFANGNVGFPADSGAGRPNPAGNTVFGDGNRFRDGPLESFPIGLGSKSKACPKFFSTAGCPFGDDCHFGHCVPGGLNSISPVPNLRTGPTAAAVLASDHQAAGVQGYKTRICNHYGTAKGCRFGEKCHFVHGEGEVRRGSGDCAITKISVDASLVGAIIGKAGMHSEQIYRLTGAKLTVRDHESDTSLKNIEFEGRFDQTQEAWATVQELITQIRTSPAKPPGFISKNYKTTPCENYSRGTCEFGESCNFAHGVAELR